MKKLIAVAAKTIFFGLIINANPIRSFAQGATNQNIIAPNAKPAVFLQQGVSVPNGESAPCFTPDGNTVYLSDNDTIKISKKINGKWMKPTIVSISGRWKDWDATLSPDGKRMVFVSNRPLDGMPQDKPQKNSHLWYSDRISGEKWSAPVHFDAPVNEDGFNDYAPSVSNSGTICFCSRGRYSNKGMCGYYTKWLGDHYDKPQRMVLNGDKDVFDPYIAPDERFIVFASEQSLFISYRRGNEWSVGEKLETQVNHGFINGGPYVSPDGKTLYYSSNEKDGILMIPVNLTK